MEPPKKQSKMQDYCDGYVPKNTQKATKRALWVFQEWRDDFIIKSSVL